MGIIPNIHIIHLPELVCRLFWHLIKKLRGILKFDNSGPAAHTQFHQVFIHFQSKMAISNPRWILAKFGIQVNDMSLEVLSYHN